jgi:hypothetical protein
MERANEMSGIDTGVLIFKEFADSIAGLNLPLFTALPGPPS